MAKKPDSKSKAKLKNRAGKALYEFFHAAEAAAKAWGALSKEERTHYRKAAMIVRRAGAKKGRKKKVAGVA